MPQAIAILPRKNQIVFDFISCPTILLNSHPFDVMDLSMAVLFRGHRSRRRLKDGCMGMHPSEQFSA